MRSKSKQFRSLNATVYVYLYLCILLWAVAATFVVFFSHFILILFCFFVFEIRVGLCTRVFAFQIQ